MIHLASLKRTLFSLFCIARLEKWGRTDGQHMRKQLSLPAVTVGWLSGSIVDSLLVYLYT